MSFSETSLRLAHDVITSAAERRLTLATAESCTGGLIGGCLTEIRGSSAVVDRGFIVYSNQAKQTLLGVGADLLDRHGAVSAEVAEAMAIGARERAGVDLAIAVTGIAGPGGATPAKPVGLVHIALAFRDRIDAVREIFQGDRRAVRAATVERALGLIKAAIGGTPAN